MLIGFAPRAIIKFNYLALIRATLGLGKLLSLYRLGLLRGDNRNNAIVIDLLNEISLVG